MEPKTSTELHVLCFITACHWGHKTHNVYLQTSAITHHIWNSQK